MEKNMAIKNVIIVAAMLFSFCSCAVGSYQGRSVDIHNSPLVNPSVFVKGTGDQALYRYVNPNVDVKKYSNMIIDPVIIQVVGTTPMMHCNIGPNAYDTFFAICAVEMIA